MKVTSLQLKKINVSVLKKNRLTVPKKSTLLLQMLIRGDEKIYVTVGTSWISEELTLTFVNVHTKLKRKLKRYL